MPPINQRLRPFFLTPLLLLLMVPIAGRPCSAQEQVQTPHTLALAAESHENEVRQLIAEYLTRWQAFYPSRSFSMGLGTAIWHLEDRSRSEISRWIAHNQSTLGEITGLMQLASTAQGVDLRLLRAQVRRELNAWDEQKTQRSDLSVFVRPITAAIPSVVDSSLLTLPEKRTLIKQRLSGIERLADAARDQWRGGDADRAEAALNRIRQTIAVVQDQLAGPLMQDGTADSEPAQLAAITALDRLVEHIETRLPTLTVGSPILGRAAYARGLSLYLDSAMSPEELEQLADAQIDDAKREIRALSLSYWRETYPEEQVPETADGTTDIDVVVARAFTDLEERRPSNNAEYLVELREYRRQIEEFVRTEEIATVPDHHTLSVEIAPESAGAMARVGYVSSAPRFAPNPWTTWNLATIPDSHPEQERIDFWRSFNYPYKKFIVVHELFPGHYLQQKLLRENPHPVRLFFGWSPFTEGWATFCEEVAFEHGWARGDALVRLAQQRKRLENANRAFMSVQAHVNGWSEQRVYQTSIERAWLGPQFAKSLWNRLMNWPFQMTTYMLGGLQLQDLYDAEKQRLGSEFNTRRFMDTLLRLGPIPIDEIAPFLEGERR